MMVAGKWDSKGGKPSGYMKKFKYALDACFHSMGFFNGGDWVDLESGILEAAISDNINLWFPDVPNDKDKLVGQIKKRNPKSILVTSKNNEDGKYDFMQLAAHALQNKSNLFIEFKKRDGVVTASIYDPLGNCFCKESDDISKVVLILSDRLRYLLRNTRIGSERVGKAIKPYENGNLLNFYEIIKENADTFHNLVHSSNPSRFMGNCSFRCTLGGFPSFRLGEVIFVSKRNIDKREIGNEGFVAVEPITMFDYMKGDVKVKYYGEAKPSVDTPIQLALYALFPYINYMIHSHTYIDGVTMTNNVVPCGAIEEVTEILEVEPVSSAKKWMVNLKGHGSIVAMDECNFMRGLPYVARVFPENHETICS